MPNEKQHEAEKAAEHDRACAVVLALARGLVFVFIAIILTLAAPLLLPVPRERTAITLEGTELLVLRWWAGAGRGGATSLWSDTGLQETTNFSFGEKSMSFTPPCAS